MNTDYLSRRGFARAAGLAAMSRLWTESALAQRALVGGKVPPDTVWLNANENPSGPGEAAIAAMKEAMVTAGRYHYQELARPPRDHRAVARPGARAGDPRRGFERGALRRGPRFHLRQPPAHLRRADLRVAHLAGQRSRPQRDSDAADSVLRGRREANAPGGGKRRRRVDLSLQPQQPDLVHHAQGRYRLAREQPSAEHRRADRRSLHSLFHQPATGQRPGSRQGRPQRCRRAHLFEDLRHGRPARRLRLRQAGTHPADGAVPGGRDLLRRHSRRAGRARRPPHGARAPGPLHPHPRRSLQMA